MQKQKIVFNRDGVDLVGWLKHPGGEKKHPLIIITHGLSGIVDLDLESYADIFCAAGFACLAYDHRNWGRSGGEPRGESDPWMQVADMREAISFARTLPEVDPDRIGLWGTSYAGGHVLTVSALDRRVRCAVSQVPLISGSRTFDAWVPAEKMDKFVARLDRDRDKRYAGEQPGSSPAAIEGSETEEWIKHSDVKGTYSNNLTVRSFDLLRTYEPVSFVERISPTPLMMIVASNDVQTPTAWQLEAFEKIGAPKRLVEINCRHYDVYMQDLEQAAANALSWYQEHL